MSTRRKASNTTADLIAAVKGGDVVEIRRLLDAGADPVAPYRKTCAALEAMLTNQEEVVRPFVESMRNIGGFVGANGLSSIAVRALAEDRFSVAFAAEMADDLDARLAFPGVDTQVMWNGLLSHGGQVAIDGHTTSPRDPVRLAGKVRVAIQHGWRPDQAWHEGWLPHHEYIDKGFVDAAVACVMLGGANPYEPLRASGLQSPDVLLFWGAFEAALREQRANEVPASFSSTTRTRQRA